jgi:cytochrome c biogenesis protein CcdA
MRFFFLSLVFFLTTWAVSAQGELTWTVESRPLGNCEFEVVAKAKLKSGWYTYSTKSYGDGPVPTSIVFESGGAKPIGPTVETSSHVKEGMDPVFEMVVKKFAEEVTFTQRYKVTQPTTVKGFIEAMVCNNEMCLPPTSKEFTFTIPKDANCGSAAAPTVIPPAVIPPTALPPTKGGKDSLKIAGISPADTNIIVGPPINDTTSTATFAAPFEGLQNLKIDKTLATSTCGSETKEEKDNSLWWTFLLGIGGGLLALLTPCVFPMIPMTVSFFTKRSKDRKTGLKNAILYGLSIIAIYTGLGLIITLAFGADALNQLSTNVWFNIALFVMLIVFGISFLGYFELTLPSSWANKMDQMSDKGGYLGIFFMAFTLAIVSFSCTGPLIGNLLVLSVSEASVGIPLKPIVGMFGFSLALALPFALFSFFPGWLQSLPKSGSWMDDVKVVLGIAEIALAFKFLSVADLTMGWKIVPYELFVGVWVLCGLVLALYFINKIRFPHTAKWPKISAGKYAFAAFWLFVAGYCGTGFMTRQNHDVTSFVTPDILSGLAPPAGHSYIHPGNCPLDLNCYKDFELGLAEARRTNKPILLDFTGHGCVNCRKMEDNSWPVPGIFKYISEDYILISLYTDDRKPLDEPIVLPHRTLRNVGNKWAWFEETYFDRVSQPYYVLLSPDLKILNQPVGYTPNNAEYEEFLRCGLERFKGLKK